MYNDAHILFILVFNVLFIFNISLLLFLYFVLFGQNYM